MRADDFDLDVVEQHDAEAAAVVDALEATELERLVAALPAELRPAATAVLVQRRTYSDVSQELGIRQPELVRALQRSRTHIARSLAG